MALEIAQVVIEGRGQHDLDLASAGSSAHPWATLEDGAFWQGFGRSLRNAAFETEGSIRCTR